ncbi:glycosyl hydrolase family 28-related protein [Actinoplanes sp. NPDC026619]|uniref:glycosyl hydrolase family 28-related protein n=1 Tax=Actinoplanes sp. NPDC026619 TaxID=3155798 RepID=UPI0033FC21F6
MSSASRRRDFLAGMLAAGVPLAASRIVPGLAADGVTTELLINVKDPQYGAAGDGRTDDTAAIQAALDAAAPNPIGGRAGRVYLPPGDYLVGPLVIGQRVTLEGAGLATRLTFKAGAGPRAVLITNAQNYAGPSDAQGVTIRDLLLDGNKWENKGTWQSGIMLNNSTPPGDNSAEWTDGRHQVHHVMIQHFTGDGFIQRDRGGVQASDIQVWAVDGFGFNINMDSAYHNCDAGGSGIDGWLIQGNNQLTGCKAWFSGSALTSSRESEPATALSVNAPDNPWDGGDVSGLKFTLAGGWGNGFHYTNISGNTIAGAWSGGTTVGCNAQDNARAGFRIDGARQTLVGCEADSNSNTGTANGVPVGGRFPGFELVGWAGANTVSGLSWNRSANRVHQAAALGLSAHAEGNRIELNADGTLGLDAGDPLMPLMTTDSVMGGNLVQFGAMGGGFVRSALGSYTPNPYVAETHALAGAATINNPSLGGKATAPGIYLIPGMRLRLMVTQGATGQAVTLGDRFRLNGKAFATTANATTCIEFIYDGVNWQAVS